MVPCEENAPSCVVLPLKPFRKLRDVGQRTHGEWRQHVMGLLHPAANNLRCEGVVHNCYCSRGSQVTIYGFVISLLYSLICTQVAGQLHHYLWHRTERLQAILLCRHIFIFVVLALAIKLASVSYKKRGDGLSCQIGGWEACSWPCQ